MAASQADPSTDDAIDLESTSDVIHELSRQICAALSLLCPGDALDKLRQAPEGACIVLRLIMSR